jgi:hypothetical protein
LRPSIEFNINNRCQDISLTSPVYFTHGGKWRVTLRHIIHANFGMHNHLEFDSRESILEGILIYRIQRSTIESNHIRLLVAWRGEYTKGLHVRAMLVEHDSELDEDKLRRIYQKYWHLLNAQNESIVTNWPFNGAKVLTVEKTNGGYKLDIFISEGDYNIIRPLRIDVDR